MNQKLLILILLIFATNQLGNSYGISTILTKFNNFFSSVNAEHKENIQIVSNKTQEQTEYFDFIIIGSGSAGSIIANRLSENPKWKILLLEAGKPANQFTKIPVFAPNFQLTHYNWNYTMEKQDGVCLAMYDQICAWPRGKALGGTTVINYMIYIRGNPLDYDKWSNGGINPGWSYKEVLPYFLKSENCNLNSTAGICENKNFHRRGGEVNIEYPFSTELTRTFLNAGIEIGDKIIDYNSNETLGYAQMQATQKHGRRVSTASAFLDPIRKIRKNLKILTSAHVTKLIINPTTKTVTGVNYIRYGKKYYVKATKEVILSAGTFNSPQLLMLSGIGPKNDLENLGIDVIHDLPGVGQTLYDHIAYLGLSFRINQTIEPKEKIFDPREIKDFFINGNGSYTSLAGVEALAYIKTKSSKELSNYPNIELIFSGVGSLEADFGVVVAPELRITRKFYNTYFKPIENYPSWGIIPMLLHPKSVGYLKLRSKDPFDPPLLYGNYLTEREDVQALIDAIRYIINLSKTKSFQKFNSTFYTKPIPGCEKLKFNSDEYWECALRHLTTTLHHQIGTCKMGPKTDSKAVVDTNLKVYGLKNLRIADCSVIPVTLSAHTNGPAMMIGEKASDIIKKEWIEKLE